MIAEYIIRGMTSHSSRLNGIARKIIYAQKQTFLFICIRTHTHINIHADLCLFIITVYEKKSMFSTDYTDAARNFVRNCWWLPIHGNAYISMVSIQ